jgi:fluoride exporter
MRTVVGISIAGAVGALARYGLEGWVSRRATAFPWGTFVVNISGAFLLGLLFTLLTERFVVAPWLRSAVTIGLLGAYTTFSTLTLETFRLFEEGSYLAAAFNIVGSIVVGLAAVFAGIVFGRALS